MENEPGRLPLHGSLAAVVLWRASGRHGLGDAVCSSRPRTAAELAFRPRCNVAADADRSWRTSPEACRYTAPLHASPSAEQVATAAPGTLYARSAPGTRPS